MQNASPFFLSRRTIELQLPADACLLQGNQHSISPSTSSPSNTCARQNPQRHTLVHKCAPPPAAPPLPLTPATSRRDANCYQPLWLFPLLFSSFLPSLLVFFLSPPKLCRFFQIPQEKLQPPPHFLAHPSWGKLITSHLPSV